MPDPSSVDVAMFQAAIDTAREAVFWVDADGRLVYVNQRACAWLAYDREAVGCLRIWDLDVGMTLERWSALWKQTVIDGLFETSYRRRDGRLFPVEVSAKGLDVGGRRLCVAFVRDISERRVFTEALRRTQVAVDRARDPIFWVKSDGSIAYANDAACELLGYPREELLRLTMQEISPSPISWEERWRRRRQENAVRFERTHRAKDGREIPVEVSVSVIEFEGEECHWVYTRDLSEQKRTQAEKARLEAELLHAQKLESVGRLAGGVAHDFNNMLTVILGYAELMASGMPDGDPLLESLAEIKKAACRSRDTTRQLLAFSRKQMIAPRAVDLNALVAEAKNALLRLIGEHIALAFQPGAGLWRVVFDPAQVEQILVNLIVNARDALPGGGRITVATANIHLAEADCRNRADAVAGDYVVLSVSDDGMGMDEQTLSHIFEPFFSTKEVGKGTGLGLATVYGVIKQNNGFIDVTSGKGRGTTFRLYIPRMHGHGVDPPVAAEHPAARGRGTILLVEDNEMVRELTRSMLVGLGYTVVTADSARAALDVCATSALRIDLLLSDIVMPGMRGPELGERLRAARPGLQVLFMSGYASGQVAGADLSAESVGFIQKPFTMTELGRTVERVLQRAPQRPPDRA
jgi:two-component system cell cycle sensor histidine kinase/response regulator CckA